jgi:hypothetical protein
MPRVRVKIPRVPPEAAPFVRALGEMLTNAAAEFADDGLERIEREILAPAAAKLRQARGVAQKRKRR